MTRFALLIVLSCAAISLTGPVPVQGAKKTTAPKRSAAAILEPVLRAESVGTVDRRQQLAEALQRQPDLSEARWQAGYLRAGREWISFDDAGRAVSAKGSLSGYRERRATAPRTAQGQLELADWCRANKLPDQERAHLSAALALDAGEEAAKIAERIGYQQVAGQWLSREQLLEWRGLNRRAKESLKKWEATLIRLADRLSSQPARDRAIASFQKTGDSSAVPAIEYLLAGTNAETAAVAIELIRRIEGHEASIALARQAIFSPWPGIRKSASAALEGRPMDHFVPDLLGLLSSPIRSEVRMWQDSVVAFDRPFGTLYYNFIIARETENQFQVAELLTVDHTLESRMGIGVGIRSGNFSGVFVDSEVLSPRFNNDWRRSIGDRLQPREDTVIRENEQIAEFNGRVGLVLAVVSGNDPQSTPQDWWQWWSDHSDVERSAPKPVVTVSEQESLGVPSLPRVVYTPSCFIAGTPVWTDTGLQPIETVQIGDRVLAKNIETGELDYKPVLQTTVRSPKELVTLRFGDETIVCTGGHRFWVSGEGWGKARNLKPQTLLHTVTGNVPVWSTKQGKTAETYNLVVADAHTYFVGKTGLFCQDLLPPRPTDNVVPGLARDHLAVETVPLK